MQKMFVLVPEAWMVHGLVDYYMESNSERTLSILTSVREPHHKVICVTGI